MLTAGVGVAGAEHGRPPPGAPRRRGPAAGGGRAHGARHGVPPHLQADRAFMTIIRGLKKVIYPGNLGLLPHRPRHKSPASTAT